MEYSCCSIFNFSSQAILHYQNYEVFLSPYIFAYFLQMIVQQSPSIVTKNIYICLYINMQLLNYVEIFRTIDRDSSNLI